VDIDLAALRALEREKEIPFDLLVRTIERRVELIKATLQQAEANTADAELIARTAASVDGVLAEGLVLFAS